MRLRYLLAIVFATFIGLGVFIYRLPETRLITLALLQALILILLFNVLAYTAVRLIQRFSYRTYLVIKKLFFGLIKLGLSFGIVVFIFDFISPTSGEVGNVSLVYYAIIPLVLCVLFADVIMNLILWLRSFVMYTRFYRISTRLFGLFVFVLVGGVSLLIRHTPRTSQYVVSGDEIILFGILPVVFIAVFVSVISYLVFVLLGRLFFRTELV